MDADAGGSTWLIEDPTAARLWTGDSVRMAELLAETIGNWRRGVSYDPAGWRIGQFERRSLASQLAGVLSEAVEAKLAGNA